MNQAPLIDRSTIALSKIVSQPTGYRDACDVARVLRPDAPVFLFSPSALATCLEAFVAGFPGQVTYAVKANSSKEVLKALVAAGLKTFDVASVAEVEAVSRVALGSRLNYHNPVKSRSEIAEAYRAFGVLRFAADDAAEIIKIYNIAGHDPRLEIAVRFRLPGQGAAVHDFSSKFGAAPPEAVELLRRVVNLGLKPILTFHPGSQCLDALAYRRHIFAASEITTKAGTQLYRLNVGGGFPVAYSGTRVPEPAQIFAIIAEATRDAFGPSNQPELECEPGRGLIAASMSLLTRVKLVKEQKAEIYLNDGIYGALGEPVQAPALRHPHRALRANGVLAAKTTAFTVFGPTCDPLDRLPVPMELPADITEGDYVEFGTLGAYGSATSTRFNGFGAASILHVDEVLTT